MKLLIKTLLATIALTGSFSAFSEGGNPIPGIDIIIKDASISQPIHSFGLNKHQMERFNTLKVPGRSMFLAKIVAKKMRKLSKGSRPQGGWQKLLKNSIASNWCGPCKMVAFRVHAKTLQTKTKYKIIFKPRKLKPVVSKFKGKAAMKAAVLKK